MSKHNKITLVCSIVTLVLVLLFSFQNCSTNQNPGNLIVNQSSIASCETAIFNSSTTGETIFSVGQIINFSLDSSPQSLGGQFLITDVNDSVIQNSNITTPTFTQQIFKNASDIGDYTYFMQLNDSSGKAICSTAKRTFTITNGQSSNPTCVFSIPSGNGQSFKVNDAIVLDVQSVPSGLQAYISGKNLSPTGAVNSTLSRVSIGATEAKQNNVAANADVGQWKRFAEVVANDGSFVRCSPLQDTTITIAALPGVTPTPPPAPTPSTSR